MVEVVIERESGGGEVSSIVPGQTAVYSVHCTHHSTVHWTSLSSILPGVQQCTLAYTVQLTVQQTVHIGEENIVVQCRRGFVPYSGDVWRGIAGFNC